MGIEHRHPFIVYDAVLLLAGAIVLVLLCLTGCEGFRSTETELRHTAIAKLAQLHRKSAAKINVWCEKDGTTLECYGTPKGGGRTIEVDCAHGFNGPYCVLDDD